MSEHGIYTKYYIIILTQNTIKVLYKVLGHS
jgi:hypothetical protein